MHSYSNFHVRDLLDAFASSTPAPGGGSAAALAGATAVSLLVMVADVRMSRSATPHTGELADTAERLRSLRAAIAELIDRDAEAYTSVVAALRLPAGDDDSRRRREAARAAAMRAAIDVPLEMMRACRRALGDAATVASHATRATRSDAGVAIELLRAAVHGAGITIEANLGSLRDLDYAGLIRAERQRLEVESDDEADRALREITP